MHVRCELGRVKMVLNTFSVRVGGLEVPLLIWEVATAYFGGCHCLSGRLPLLIWWVGGKMNLRIRLTSAKVGVGVEVEAELGKRKNFLTDFG